MLNWLKKHISLPAMSEKVLLFRAKSGDRDAFAALYQRYLDRMYRYIYYKVDRDKSVAEDLTATVFIRAMEHLPSLDEQGYFRAWLYRIAHNCVIDHYRMTKPRVALHENIMSVENVERHFENEDRKRVLTEALSKLTDEQREAILLRYIENLPSKEIAVVMHKQNDAVRALIHRGLQRLRELLKKNYGSI